MQEQTIIELLLQKDERGMDELLLHFGPLMRYVIAPLLQNPQDREDCLSESAMRVWEKIALFNASRGGFTAWLTAIARNTAINYTRSAARHNSAGEMPEDAPSPEPTPEESVLQEERRAALNTALRRLPPADKALFYRKYYYLQPTAQIARELGLTERAVEGRLYRMKKQLRKMLGGETHE